MLKLRCEISSEEFEVSPEEQELRTRLGAPLPKVAPAYTFRELLAFWQHFAMHRRTCDLSGKSIISVFDQNCPYPVWNREDWLKGAKPPQADFNFSRPFFEQLWQLFQRCPIAHNVGLGNENCEYTDDWWYSKNCYLCHSGVECEDCYYCYRTLSCTDCQYCIFSNICELCRDLLNCSECQRLHYSFHSRACRDSYFLFDCRNCHDCLFCWNLRNKSYCIENEQLTKEQYLERLKTYNFSSRQEYQRAQEHFEALIQTKAYWKALDLENCQNCRGGYLTDCKNAHDCFFALGIEDASRFVRGGWLKDAVDCVCGYKSERVYYSALPQDDCYDVRFCCNVMKSRFVEYCVHCYNCSNCFACCGLVNAEYHILNKPFQPQDYKDAVARIKEYASSLGEYGQFFPGYFAANPYEESLAGYYFPLSREEQIKWGFRVGSAEVRERAGNLAVSSIPDSVAHATTDITKNVYWDEFAKRPFQITAFDLDFAKRTGTPLPEMYYIRRIKDIFRWMFFDGSLRTAKCALSQQSVLTNLPLTLDKRILCEESYLAQVF